MIIYADIFKVSLIASRKFKLLLVTWAKGELPQTMIRRWMGAALMAGVTAYLSTYGAPITG